jgi:hypothetical protein
MEFKQAGNLGKTDLLIRHLTLKQMRGKDGSIHISEEELGEINDQLDRFRHLMANLNLYSNRLANDDYNALVGTINELEKYYRNYE